MPAPAYSTRFIHNVGQGFLRYTVPAGYRAVLKSVIAYNGNAGVANVVLELKGTNIWFVAVPGFAGGSAPAFMLPVYAGEVIGLYNQISGVNSALSGYLLRDIAGGATVGPLPSPDTEPNPLPTPHGELEGG